MLPHLYRCTPTYNPASSTRGVDFVFLNPSDEHGLGATHLHTFCESRGDAWRAEQRMIREEIGR